MAIEASDITLISGSLTGVPTAIGLSRATMRNIRQNLFFALVYNALGVPIAAGALYPLLGIRLNPVIAAAAMALSSLSVVANANRLRRHRTDHVRTAALQDPIDPTPERNTAMTHDHEGDCGHHANGGCGHHEPAAGEETAECPVMGGTVVRSDAEAEGLFRDFEGRRYWFCCAACAPQFDADPAKYATAA
nr:YHS domain-containing protein [Glycomyces salinus]